jgi:hypothetical protein
MVGTLLLPEIEAELLLVGRARTQWQLERECMLGIAIWEGNWGRRVVDWKGVERIVERTRSY